MAVVSYGRYGVYFERLFGELAYCEVYAVVAGKRDDCVGALDSGVDEGFGACCVSDDGDVSECGLGLLDACFADIDDRDFVACVDLSACETCADGTCACYEYVHLVRAFGL